MTKNDKKTTKKIELFADGKNCIFLEALSFFVIFRRNFRSFSLFCGKLRQNHKKMIEKWQKNDRKMTMLREKCNFCHLQKCNFFCHFFVIFLLFCAQKFCHFLSFWYHFLKNGEKDRKILWKMTEKWQKNDNASRKMQFLPPAKAQFFLSFFCQFFVILWKFCHFFVILVQFSQK